MGAAHRDAEDFPGEHVGGGRTAADVGRAARGERAVRSLGAAKAELDDRFALGGLANPGGFGGDESLEIEDVEQRGF